MSTQSYQEYLESVWSEEHQGFPWWMETDALNEQSWTVQNNFAGVISDCTLYTEDAPKLNKHEFQYVFVYGTLKRSKSNHVQMKRGCEFLCEAYTMEDHFYMKETKQGRIPVVLSCYGDNTTKHLGARIRGELYLVETKQMNRLDTFEQNGYIYRRVKVRTMVNQFTIPAWMYLGVKKAWEPQTDLIVSHRFEPKKSKLGPYYDYVGHDLGTGVK